MVDALINILTMSPIHTIACAIVVMVTLSATIAFISGLKAGVYDAAAAVASRRLAGHDYDQNLVIIAGKEDASPAEDSKQSNTPDVSINSFSYDHATGHIVMTVGNTLVEGKNGERSFRQI